MPLGENHFKPQRNPLNFDVDGENGSQGGPSPLDLGPIELPAEDFGEPIEMASAPEAEEREVSRITTFETNSVLVNRDKRQFKRDLSQGSAATRIRVFHTKLSDTAMGHMEEMINEWIDSNPDVEVKFTNTTVGVVEGKRSEPHLIITVWY